MNVEDLIRGKVKSEVRQSKRRPKPLRVEDGFIVVITDPYSNKRVGEVYERHQWLVEMVGRKNYTVCKRYSPCLRHITHHFVFQDKNHAMLFKLTWGGR